MSAYNQCLLGALLSPMEIFSCLFHNLPKRVFEKHAIELIALSCSRNADGGWSRTSAAMGGERSPYAVLNSRCSLALKCEGVPATGTLNIREL